MPITEHEKLRVHSRSSSDLLAAVPIKKRHFLFSRSRSRSPSPPPESRSPIPADCGISDEKPESSDLGPPCSKIGGGSAQVNIVKGEVDSCVSHDLQVQTSADCVLPEKKPESSEPGSHFLDTAQMNVVMGKVASCEFRELPSPAAPDCHLPEMKPGSSQPASAFLISGGNCAQVNIVTGENASCVLPPASDDCGISEKKLETLESGSPFPISGVDTAQMNAMIGEYASYKPSELLSPTPPDYGRSEKKPESSEPESIFSETRGNPVQMNSVTGNVTSSESHEESVNRHLNICPKPEILPTLNGQGSRLNEAYNSLDGAGDVQEMVPSSKYATRLVNGSMVIPSAAKQTCLASSSEGNVDGKSIPSEGISVKKEASELQNVQTTSSDTNLKADSSQFCLNRSNWDLNTTMDAWEGSSADSLLNNGDAEYARLDRGCIQNKNLELGLNQISFKEAKGPSMRLENYELQRNNHHLKLPNLNSEACLDLQLKSSFFPNSCSPSGKHDANRETPFPSPLAAGRTVKSEPIENDQKEAGKAQLGVLKSPVLKHVKTEPPEGQEICKTMISGKLNLAFSGVIKPEPLENQSQGCVRSSEGSSFPMGQKCHSLEPQSTIKHQNTCKDDSKASDVASKPLVSSSLLYTCTDEPNTNVSSGSSDKVEKAQDLVNQTPIPGNDMSISTGNDSNGIATEPSTSQPKSLVSDGNEMNSFPEACETSTLPVAVLTEAVTSNGEGYTKGAPNLVQMDCSNAHHSPNATLADEVLGKICENSKVVESDEFEGKVGVSSDILEQPCESISKSDGSHVAAGAMNTVRKQCGKDDEDYEDGEVRCPALNGTVEGSSGVTEEQQVKASVSVTAVDVPILVPALVDEKESKEDSSKEATKESDAGLLENKIERSSLFVGPPTADSDKGGLSKTICRIRKDHLKSDKGLERNLKSSDLSTKTIPPDSQSGAASSKQQNVEGPSIAGKYVASKTELSGKEGVTKDANDGCNRRIIYLNSASRCLSSGKWKSTADGPISLRGERERPVDRSFRRERSRSRGSRDDSSNERSRKVEGERHYGHQVEKCRSGLLHMRSRDDRLNALRGDRNSSNGIRYSRPISAAEVAIGASLNDSNRLTRKLTNEEIHNPSRLPCKRRSPGGRVQIPFGRHPIGDFSPSRCIGRDDSDFVLRAHEENLLRNLPEDMSMLSHSRSQYERADGVLLHRERRSLSPPLRRAGPLQMPPNCSQSSPRSQQRASHHWSPLRRTSDGFNGPRELGHCRSPPVMRVNRMESPEERPCFPEDIIVRRRGSPPYISRLPNDMVDVGPAREHDFPGLVRDSNRNMRRFNMIDPREMMEEEYFGPPLVRGQIREFGVDDEFVEDRRCSERRGPVRSFRQHCISGDNERESFHFHDDDGSPRGLRLHPDAIEDFPEGSGPRDFDLRFRNRLGNPSGRLRGIAQEQEDNYRRHGVQEWRNTAFNDGRAKRRRF